VKQKKVKKEKDKDKQKSKLKKESKKRTGESTKPGIKLKIKFSKKSPSGRLGFYLFYIRKVLGFQYLHKFF